MIPTTKRVKLPRFLPPCSCTHRTVDLGSSVSPKSSEQPPPCTADRATPASPCPPESRSARWRGSSKKTWSSIGGRPQPIGISTPPHTSPLAAADGRALHSNLPAAGDEGDLDAALSAARSRLLVTNRGRRLPLRVSASNPVARSADCCSPLRHPVEPSAGILSHTRGQQRRLTAGSHKQRLSTGSHKHRPATV